ncbi:UNVERIFIED_CONTAM: Chymotrypsin inhibitor [Trichonephila clavipes]
MRGLVYRLEASKHEKSNTCCSDYRKHLNKSTIGYLYHPTRYSVRITVNASKTRSFCSVIPHTATTIMNLLANPQLISKDDMMSLMYPVLSLGAPLSADIVAVQSNHAKSNVCAFSCLKSADSCRSNEVYKQCGSACPPTCSNRGENQICTLQCVAGCFCKEGLVRDDQGECVEPEDCPQSTQEPQGLGGPTKDDIQKNLRSDYPSQNHNLCNKRISAFRNRIHIRTLFFPVPHPCPENQQHYECIPSCKRTCMTYNSSSAFCAKEVCLKGCFCKEGYVMNKNGECVRPEKCPTREYEFSFHRRSPFLGITPCTAFLCTFEYLEGLIS